MTERDTNSGAVVRLGLLALDRAPVRAWQEVLLVLGVSGQAPVAALMVDTLVPGHTVVGEGEDAAHSKSIRAI